MEDMTKIASARSLGGLGHVASSDMPKTSLWLTSHSRECDRRCSTARRYESMAHTATQAFRERIALKQNRSDSVTKLSHITRSSMFSVQTKHALDRLQRLIRAHPEWRWRVDEQYRYTELAKSVLVLLGRERDEVLSKKVVDFMTPPASPACFIPSRG
jgi:PAS domain-containing protein